jgi:uncharacterized protein (TIGR02453 family)
VNVSIIFIKKKFAAKIYFSFFFILNKEQMAGGRKRRLVKYEEDSDFEEEKTTKKSKTTDDEEDQDMQVISESSFRPSKITIPRPAHGPFPDALSADSLEFLASLAENNDRDFMHVKAKEWERTRKDFTDFVGLLAKEIHQADPSVRLEQPKHAVYRQHRDLRFTNDKRPYKTNLSASFSRSGRKFLDAGYHLSIKPGHQSFFAAGIWQPGKTMLENIRQNMIRHGNLLREALSTEAVQEVFGQTGTAILSDEDKLKVAPKNVARDHPEIELLRYKSVVVVKTFTDQEVVSEGFIEKVMDAAEALVPLVAVLNAWV